MNGIEIVGILELIDCGKFRQAQELLAHSAIDEFGLSQILAAEVDIYFNRLDSAATRLEQVTSSVADEALLRFAAVRGQLHYWKFEYEQAEDDLQLAYQISKFRKDWFQMAAALFNLGRLRRRQSKFGEALELLERASDLLSSQSTASTEQQRFVTGLITLNKAICVHQLGDSGSAGKLYVTAIELLRRTEECRYYGNALNSYGGYLKRSGRYQEALSSFEDARKIFEGLGTFDELGATFNNLALALMRLNRLDEAERFLTEALKLHQQTGNISFAASSLSGLADLYLQTGEVDRARRFATQALEQADLSRNLFDQSEANLMMALVALQESTDRGSNGGGSLGNACHTARSFLEKSLELGQKIGSKDRITVTTIYLAEVYLGISVVRGRELLEQARELVYGYGDVYYLQEFERIAQLYQGQRIKITSDNRISISGNFLPKITEAKEEIERFLIKNALEQSGDNQSEAGRLLGVSKVYIHQKRKQFAL